MTNKTLARRFVALLETLHDLHVDAVSGEEYDLAKDLDDVRQILERHRPPSRRGTTSPPASGTLAATYPRARAGNTTEKTD